MSTTISRAASESKLGGSSSLAGVLVLSLLMAVPVVGSGGMRTLTECPAVCLQCPLDPQYFAGWRWNSSIPGTYNHVHETCNMVNCQGGACGDAYLPFGSPESRLAALADLGDIPGLLRAYERHPTLVRYLPDRHAIQVVGCGGAPIAHLSLSPVQLVE